MPGMSGTSIAPRDAVLDRLPALRAQFAERRRVVVEELLPCNLTEQLAEELKTLRFERVANSGLSGSSNAHCAPFWYYTAQVEADPRAQPSPLRAFVRSVLRGPIHDLIEAITGFRRLRDRPFKGRPTLVAHAYPRGGYVEAHSDGTHDRVGIVFHLSRHWEEAWGGQLRFTEEPTETLLPTFGAMHLFEFGPGNRHEVAMITGPELRYTLHGRLFEPRL